MCGIAGIYRFGASRVEEKLLEGMGERLGHRGPDGKGICLDQELGLVHRRLKIIDLSDRADQPMTDTSGCLTISYNGEIYNYLELRKELEGEGYCFRSGSDTEVILAAYAKWKAGCVKKFNVTLVQAAASLVATGLNLTIIPFCGLMGAAMSLAMGRVYVGLCKLGKGQKYCERAKALSTMFKNRLMLKDDRYVWNIFGTTLEDISHGAIDIAFACDAFDAGTEFTRNDMLLFSRTLIRAFNGSQFAKFIDGSGDDDSVYSYSLASARWLDLSAFGCEPYKTVCFFFEKYLTTPRTTVSPQVLLGISKLIKYWEKCM
jgi:Glutamine amidotransferase domain